jgi:hypothetical protein
MYKIELANDMIIVAPNPARENIELRSRVPVRELSLCTIHGDVVASSASNVPPAAAGVYSLPVPHVPPGVYALRITTDLGFMLRMVVIE